MKIEGINRT